MLKQQHTMARSKDIQEQTRNKIVDISDGEVKCSEPMKLSIQL